MISRRFFLLGLGSFLSAYILPTIFTNNSTWGKTQVIDLIQKGNAHIFDGNYEGAIALYKQALSLPNLDYGERIATINNLVNGLRLQREELLYKAKITKNYNQLQADLLIKKAHNYHQEAVTYAQRAYEQSLPANEPEKLDLPKLVVENAHITAWMDWKQLEPNRSQNDRQILALIQEIPSSPTKVRQLIRLASLSTQRQKQLIETALVEARKINYLAGNSLACGQLAKIYRQQGNSPQALELNSQALKFARLSQSVGLLYQWLWQAGQTHKAMGKIELAKENYRQAIKYVENLKANRQLSILEKRQLLPLYQEYLGLLLDSNELETALKVADLLQIVRLENYFQEKCLEVKAVSIPLKLILAATDSALIRFVVLSDKTHVIYLLSNGQVHKETINLSYSQFRQLVQNWYASLRQITSLNYKKTSFQLYEWIIFPLQKYLKAAGLTPSKLVIISEEFLSNIPVGALINPDTLKYLLQEYTIISSLTGILQLSPSPLIQRLNLLGFGLVSGSESLPFVAQELQTIKSQVAQAEIFLDREFTVNNLDQQVRGIQQPTILHLASHGEFNGLAETSFLEAYDEAIYVPNLRKILEKSSRSISLLVLSACETAVGSSDSLLGMVGTAFLAGINQNLGTLWQVKDEDIAQIMRDFYDALGQGFNVADSLRNAQLKKIQEVGSHPYQWAAPIFLTTTI